jgi:LysM repeat protein
MNGRSPLLRTALPAFTGASLLVFLLVAPVRAEDGVHVVAPGESLSTLARKYDTSVKEIAKANHLQNIHQLRVGQRLLLPASARREIVYVVKKGDALSRIARNHGVSTRSLVEANGLSSADRLRIGDEIRIPVAGAARKSIPLSSDLRRRLVPISVQPRRWRYIVIHHSASARGTINGMDRFHREEKRMKNGLAYHFVIGNGQGIPDGKIEIGNRWVRQLNGGHLASEALNRQCIGICLVGNFEERKPSQKQIASLHAITTYLTRRCRLDRSRIQTHQQINTKPTLCPGRHFSITNFLSEFQA